MSGDQITLTGHIGSLPDITYSGTDLQARFTVIYCPNDAEADSATVPCILYDALASREDAEAFLVPGTAVRVTGNFSLPSHDGDPLVLEVKDIEEDIEEDDEIARGLELEVRQLQAELATVRALIPAWREQAAEHAVLAGAMTIDADKRMHESGRGSALSDCASELEHALKTRVASCTCSATLTSQQGSPADDAT